LFPKANGPQLELRAVRWTVVDWPRGGHSTWPLRQLRAPGSTCHPGGNQSLLSDSLRAVAFGPVLADSAPKPRLERPRSKSQPPHLVFEYIYYCHQNLSSDHLLSGVSAD